MKGIHEDNIRQLGEESIPKLLLTFSLPVVVALLINALYNIIDRIFIGNGAGSLGIAGITLVFPIMLIMGACAAMIGTGGALLVSIKLGEKKVEEAESIIGNSLALLIILAIIITILGRSFVDPILRVFGASSYVLPYAGDYMRVIMLGTIFQMTALGMNYFIRAEGRPRKAMLTMLIGAVINTILAPIFIFSFKWGIKGAALATIISQAVSAAWVMGHFLGGKSYLKIRVKNIRLLIKEAASILSIGAASFIMQIAGCFSSIIMNKKLAYYGGDVAVSAMGASFSIFFLMILPVLGISQGIQPIIGFNYGAQKPERIKKTIKSGIAVATILTISGFFIIMLFPQQIMSLFNSHDEEFIAFGSYVMRFSMIALPLLGLQIIVPGYFQAVGKPKQAMFLTLSRQVFFLVPALLILPKYFQLFGVLVAIPLSDFLASVITGIWLFVELRSLDKKQTIDIKAHTR
ncbi:putative efflux protein, MATE family [Desulfotomaculum arcticum]|uniref:Multidrug export protein MepA n=1 Tax=Desulfotruncus arcticus DSM 17038 TaxID=1121424 RepID=A0A1I2U3S5_9FIRM|nr:MATE family efflux transporter [Desulfotruncus arcticus]SFG71815.1 putative efflux protein, MATE family [Desulfotomaculum arcticum] [Desulfotruncus arcticus DSM 17038]